uniref:Uncharacterized protein n=1 Tax=viral metagenome TaxID=1070528 RepID=A0A6M3XGM8_9ZZZZ
MKKIKEILRKHYPTEIPGDQNILCALQLLHDASVDYKVYVIHLLQSGLDVYIDEETYKQITCTQIFIDGKIKCLDDYPDVIMPCNDIKSVKVIQQEMWKLKNVICNGQFHEEFIVSKYGIEHIMEVK